MIYCLHVVTRQLHFDNFTTQLKETKNCYEGNIEKKRCYECHSNHYVILLNFIAPIMHRF